MDYALTIKNLCNAVVFAGVGAAVLALSFWVFDRLTPGELWKEVVEKQNMAMAIVSGAMTLSLGWIIAAAIHG